MSKFQPRRNLIRSRLSLPAALSPLPRTLGQSLLEFAFIAPFLLLVIFSIIDMARLIQAQVSVNNAARQGLRFAVTGYQDRNANGTYIPRATSVVSAAVQGLTGLPLSNTNNPGEWGFHQVDISPADAGRASQEVDVYVYYNVEMLTPLVNMVVSHVLVRGVEKGINEPWGAVQNFDHANLPTPPPPPPTWTPMPSPTTTPTMSPTRPTNTPTRTPTRTRTSTPTSTPTSTSTNTPSVTPTNAPTGTATNTPTS